MMINIESATQLWFLGHTSLKKAAPEAAAKLAADELVNFSVFFA
jgi:hypothetical protein